MKIRVVVADDHAVLRSGLRMLINAQADMELIEEVADGEEAVKSVKSLKPDVLVLDITMPGKGGIPAIPGVLQNSPKTRVLVMTMHDDPAYLRAVMAAGASGYVVKSAAATELLTAIRAVAQGRTFVDVPLSQNVAQDILVSKKPGRSADGSSALLNERERQVLTLVASGHTNQEVADQLDLSVKSVETYRSRLMDKLHLGTRAELVHYALEHGFLVSKAPPEQS